MIKYSIIKSSIFMLSILILIGCGCNDSKSSTMTDYTKDDSSSNIDKKLVNEGDENDVDIENDIEDESYSETYIYTPNQYQSFSEEDDDEDENEGTNQQYVNYEENSNCVDGVVVYEGRGDYYIVETNKGFTILETYSGFLSEGDEIRGELNKYNFTYIIKINNDSEIKVYIEDYMLSDERALEWLGEHDRLEDSDQDEYNKSKESYY